MSAPATLPVRLAPVPIRTILLATDLGPASSAAAERAVELAARLRADLLVVSVIDPGGLRLAGGRAGARMDQVRAERECAARTLVALSRGERVSARFLVWEGEPGESIVDAAASEGADLIVVGTHGRRGVGRFVIGSVSEFVVRHATVPVLVVRPPGAEVA